MATTITAGNATNGAAISSDGTGTLDIKTGTGAGTLALNINASQTVTMPGNLVVAGTATIGGQPAGGNYAMNAYVAPATWTKPDGLKAIKVTVIGAGGNGGGVTAGGSGGSSSAGGGGAGGAAIDYIPAPSIPGPVAVTAGPGTNSFGAFCSATAGSAAGSAPGGAFTATAGGAGGIGTGGTFNVGGGGGGAGAGQGFCGGAGGNSMLGAGARGVVASPNLGPSLLSPGQAGGIYGGGGGGGSRNSGTTAVGSGAGANGIVIVEEFY
jgi:hypothetical protein